VPVSAPAQRFATVHYYQQGPVALGYESQALAGYKAGFGSQYFGSQSYGAVPNVYYNTPSNAVLLNGEGLKTAEQLAVTGSKVSYGSSGFAAPAYGNGFYGAYSGPASFYSSTSSPASFYSSTSSPASFYSSTSSPASFYSSSTPASAGVFSSTASPVGFFGSNVASKGFVSSSAEPFSFGQQSLFGSSTPNPFESFPAGLASSDAFKSDSSADSVSADTVTIGAAKGQEKVESKTEDSTAEKK
jgi:hypothetical protein